MTYAKHRKPILTIADALKYPNDRVAVEEWEQDEEDTKQNVLLYPEDGFKIGKDVDAFQDVEGARTIKGEFAIGTQHHIHLEPQVSTGSKTDLDSKTVLAGIICSDIMSVTPLFYYTCDSRSRIVI